MDAAVKPLDAPTDTRGFEAATNAPRWQVFARLFGIAITAHVVGNWSQPDIPAVVGWVNLAAGLLGLALMMKPTRPLLLIGSGLVIASVLLEMPVTGNHWVIAGLVATAILVTRGDENRYFPTARLSLLVFYGFAAFAKLNSGFFDPTVSCAVFYANQSLGSFGLPSLDVSGLAARTLIWATVAIEISVPLTLLWRRTRYFGVLLGTVFHTFISFDLDQHFYDFTAVLTALFVLFLPDRSIGIISEQLADIARRKLVRGKLVVGMIGVLVLLSVFPLTPVTAVLLSRLPFIFWIPFSLLWVVALVRARGPGAEMSWTTGVAGAIVVVVTVLNGLTPYTEIKTAYSFNMYANLVTSQGESNHFLVRSTWPLRSGYEAPVEIVRSSDDGLNAYRDEGYLLAFPQLRRYLSVHPDVSLTFRRNGEITALNKVSAMPELVDPGPWWWRFFPLRAIDTRNPPLCQAAFLGAL
jgi:hypothetical protein